MIINQQKYKDKGNNKVVFKDGLVQGSAVLIFGRDADTLIPIYQSFETDEELFEKVDKFKDRPEAKDPKGNYYLPLNIMEWYFAKKKAMSKPVKTVPDKPINK